MHPRGIGGRAIAAPPADVGPKMVGSLMTMGVGFQFAFLSVILELIMKGFTHG